VGFLGGGFFLRRSLTCDSTWARGGVVGLAGVAATEVGELGGGGGGGGGAAVERI
jgi:hypothetical protein